MYLYMILMTLLFGQQVVATETQDVSDKLFTLSPHTFSIAPGTEISESFWWEYIDSFNNSQYSTLLIKDCLIDNENFPYGPLNFSKIHIENSGLTLKGLKNILSSTRPETLQDLYLKNNLIDHQSDKFLDFLRGISDEDSNFIFTTIDLSNNPCGGQEQCKGHSSILSSRIKKIIWE